MVPRYVLEKKNQSNFDPLQRATNLKAFFIKNKESYIRQYGGDMYYNVLNVIDLVLTIAGLIPGLGIPIDLASAMVSFLMRDYISAVLSIINAIPIAGYASAPIKILKKIANFVL